MVDSVACCLLVDEGEHLLLGGRREYYVGPSHCLVVRTEVSDLSLAIGVSHTALLERHVFLVE